MHKRFVIVLMAIMVFSMVSANPLPETLIKQEPFFDLQDNLFTSVRIPKLVVAQDGTVLAFADSCRVVRRSSDQGQTWSNPERIAPDATGNVIVDEMTGDVLHVCGKGYLYRSRDNGKTWDRETIVVRPNAAGHGSPDHLPINLLCSEAGVTLKSSKYKGRLLIPGRISPPKGNNDQEYWPYFYNTSVYSDDHGKTWQVGDPVQSGTGEGTLAELSDGRIYYNSRCHMAVDHRRRIAWSFDGGNMWVDWSVSDELFEVGQPYYYKYGSQPSYGCNAGLRLMPLSATDGKDVLLYSAPDNPGGERTKMTVWASFNKAKTWPVKRLVYAGPSAYSSVVADKNGMIYLLFENGKIKTDERISLARFNLSWLKNKD